MKFLNFPAWKPADWVALLCAFGLLLQLLGGWANVKFGWAIYMRDFFVGAMLVIGLALDRKSLAARKLQPFLVFMALVTIMMGFAAIRGFLVPAALVVKWQVLWMAALFSGYRLQRVLGMRSVIVFLGLIILYCCVDAAVGFWEYREGRYAITYLEGEKTVIGYRMGMAQEIEGTLRVRGLQRSVFIFANLMATAALACLSIVLITEKRRILKLAGLILAAGFCFMLFVSGGRSAFLGVILAVLWLIYVMLTKRKLRMYGVLLVILSLLAVAGLTLVGIGPVIEAAVQAIRLDSPVGNVNSSYDRDMVWRSLLDIMNANPVSWFFGMPLGGGPYEALIKISDNWLMWNLYHLGALGFILFLIAFTSLTVQSYLTPRIGAVAVMWGGFLFGEGIARESFFFFASIVYFFILGAVFSISNKGIPEGPRGRVMNKRKASTTFYA